jgi:hypothetical protein
MAKKSENNQESTINNEPPQESTTNDETVQGPQMVKVKLIANIKYGEFIHSIGETIEINESDKEEFEKARVIAKTTEGE